MPERDIYYKRSRFATRLPTDRMYTRGHFWLLRRDVDGQAVWRVGLTKFAIRMLGEMVEHDFEVAPGGAVSVGQTIGWLEGFKAASDLYCVVNGSFVGGNPRLHSEISLVESDPYGEGWLYEVLGEIEPEAVDVAGYTAFLDATIDKMQGEHDVGLLDDDRPQDAGGKC